MNWKGYSLRAVTTNEIFPEKYINIESWSCTPNQREELEAYRDDNSRDLYRITADGMKSTFSFDIRENLHLADIEIIQKFFTNAESNAKERKVELEYWNDEDMNYKTGYFYRPNLKFAHKYHTKSDIIYMSHTLEFIEY